MSAKTHYIAPLSLWIVVRQRFLETGQFIEPAWVSSSENDLSGPVIFVSRVLAETYVHLRNAHYDSDDSGNWKVIALQDFNLLAHAHDLDGPLHCMITFGFSMEDAESVICVSAPRLRYVPLSFSIPRESEAITFSFNQWVFDFIKDEWKTLGLLEFEQELEEVDELDANALDRLIKTATARLRVCVKPSGHEGPWAVFSTRQEVWIAGQEVPPLANRSVH